MSDQVFYLFSAVLLGLVLGALFMYFASGSNKDDKETISGLKSKLDEYQQEVSTHFEETADLVDELTNSYKKVFDHLGKSARRLMTDEQIQLQIEKRKGNKVTLEFLTETPLDTNVKQAPEEIKLKQDEENTQIGDEADEIHAHVHGKSDEPSELNIDEVEEAELVKNVDEDADLEQEVEIREKNIYS